MADMKRTEARAQLRDMTVEDLHNEIAAQRATLFSLRRRNAMKQLENTAAIRTARKQIARVKTILRERELAIERGAK